MSACCGPSRPSDPDYLSGGAVHREAGPGAGAADGATTPALVRIPGGTFTMGTDDPRGYPEDGEGPTHPVALSPYEIGRYAVTNAEFDAFVTATGHRTSAEEFGNSFVFGGLLPDDFPPTRGVAAAPWWREVLGADWRHPEGPHSDLEGRWDHPVVHVSWTDATAFCAWSGTRLPTEAEWERAARGGREGSHYPWGDEREPEGRHLMNAFQGTFPQHDSGADGWVGTAPTGSYPPNDFGLQEMTGNVWEWCSDWFALDAYVSTPRVDPKGPERGAAKVMRGGSYLCHDSYCWRYRVDARSSNTPDSTTGNLGFRVAR